MRPVSSAPSGLVRFLGGLLLSSGLLLGGLCAVSLAQVTTALTPDGTLGTAVTRDGNIYTIMGGTRPGNGPNLFHSFDRFSVGTGDTASFTGPQTGITNILSRVTGGQRSDIDGKLRSEIPGANLYLLNPAGVLFGPNASLEVSGSFHVSTADYLRLADGARFFARLSDTSTLSVAPPVAFGFLGPTPATITVQGSTLQVPEGQTLSVIGGDMAIAGRGALPTDNVPTLGAQGGRIQLASVASAGEIPVNLQEFQGDRAMRLGRVALSQGALIDASGNGGGTVRIRSGRLMVDQAEIFADNQGKVDGTGLGVDLESTAEAAITNGALITTDSLRAGRARDLRLTADSVHLENAFIGSWPSASGDGGHVLVQARTLTLKGGSILKGGATISTRAQGDGNAGSLVVQVGTLTMTDGARITSGTLGRGQGGSVTVVATDTVALTGPNSTGRVSGLFNTTTGTGNAGSVTVQAGKVVVTDGAVISGATQGSGQGGTITVRATDAIALAGQDSQGNPSGLLNNARSGTGRAGNLFVSAPHLEMAGGVIQAASDIASRGDAGAIRVEVGTLTLTGGAQIDAGTRGPGQGGTVTVVATDTIALADPLSGLFAVSDTGSRGNAGTIRVEGRILAITGGARISSGTRGPGQGGTVTVVATDTIALGQNSEGHISGLFSDTTGAGNAGTVTVQAGKVIVTGGAEISTSTESSGQGGTVTVRAADTITLTGQDSQGNRSGLFNNALSGTGRAGNLFVSAPHLEMAGGFIQAASGPASRGDAGPIRVEVGTLVMTDGARISSSTQGSGQGGTVTVVATDTVTIAGQNSGLSTNTRGQGQGGDIVLQARQIQLTEGAVISADSTGAGDAGSLTLTAQDTVLLRGHSAVTAAASQAKGGNIRVTASSLVRLQDSQITATVGGGTGDGGNVTIDPEFIVLQGSQITANAVAGNGGRIALTAFKAFLADPSSAVTASSTLGINGEVNIQAPVTNISGTLVALPQAFARATALLSTRCAERLREGHVSSLVVQGRDGVPARPGGVLPLPLSLVSPEAAEAVGTAGPPEDMVASRVGVLHIDDHGQAQVRGWPSQGFVPAVLALECAK